MNKQKIIICVISAFVVVAVLGYAYLCYMSEKPKNAVIKQERR